MTLEISPEAARKLEEIVIDSNKEICRRGMAPWTEESFVEYLIQTYYMGGQM
jgi:hypothetical protein